MVVAEIIDWVGTLEEPFGANSYPNHQQTIEDTWKEEFPEIPSDDSVQGVVCQLMPIIHITITNLTPRT